MRITAAIANSLWIASSFGAWRSFRNALQHPAQAQQRWLQHHLARHANSAFARHHKLEATSSYQEFSRRVPLQNYESLEPWIKRIQQGEPNVLVNDRVTHLIPTSGSIGARKLIPFTAGLQRDFDRAIAPWIFDLARQHPYILGGPAYWSISPGDNELAARNDLISPDQEAPPPIGFADDSSYLGGFKGWLVRAALVTPQKTLPADDLTVFQRATLLALLQERDLRLISVWHPSFLTLLLDAMPLLWRELLATSARQNPRRARELERADPQRPESIWPQLRVISCWGDGHAELGFLELQRRFPRTHLQRKGLLATEAFVTIPFAEKHPLAIQSHFFEFVDESGRCHCAQDLREGETYEVIVTTAGGLWRYRLGDLVRVTGFMAATPTLLFLGRTGNTSDLRGEKLSEAFVAASIQRITDTLGQPKFAMLAPETPLNAAPYYTLFLNHHGATAQWQPRLEAELRGNPHYDYCRRLGQLTELRVCQVGDDAAEIVLRHEAALGKRLGEIKLSFLSKHSNWSEILSKPGHSATTHRPIQPPSMFSTAPLR